MKQLSSAIRKSRQFQTIIMTTTTSSKKNITQITNQLKQLASNQGLASLSASQLGHQFSTFVMLQSQFLKPQQFNTYKCKSTQYSAIINPKILDYSIEQISGWQQCASYPNLRFKIKRSTHIIAEYEKSFKDRESIREEFKGFDAVVFQHEYTHARCERLFDIAEDVEMVVSSKFSDSVKGKLKEEFAKFRTLRDESRKESAQNNCQNSKQTNPQNDKPGAPIFNYNHAKSLRDFIQFEIVDPV